MRKVRTLASAETEFWAKVDKSRGGCWVWTGCVDSKGYGTFRVDGKSKSTHRLAWRLTHGEWPKAGLFVCHSCDNPPCVNPSHLWLGTCLDNVRDAQRKRRLAKHHQVECLRGHPFSPENTRYRQGRRHCRLCDVVRSAAYKRRKLASISAPSSDEGER